MRVARSLLASALALVLVSPVALAADGRGEFLTPQDAALWGEVRFDTVEGTLLHTGPAGSLAAEAAALTVTVVTTTMADDGTQDTQTEDHAFTLATLASAEGAALMVQVGPYAPLAMGAPGAAPASRDAMKSAPPTAIVHVQGQDASKSGMCQGSDCGAPQEVQLAPLVPARVEGALAVLLLPGGSLTVQAAEGEQTFQAGDAEQTTQGGVTLPVVGTVGQTERHTMTHTVVMVTAAEGVLHVTPTLPEPGTPARSPLQPQPEPRAFTTYVLANDTLQFHLDGALGLREATGHMEVAGDAYDAKGNDVLVDGALEVAFDTAKAAARSPGIRLEGSGAPGNPTLAAAFRGDVRVVDLAGAGAADRNVYQAASLGAAVGAAGLLALFAPAAKYSLGRVVAAPLYARLGRQQVLDHGMRGRLLELIRREPGLSPGDISRQVDCGWSTLVYHLGVLEREGYINKAREGRRWRFFPVGAQHHSALPLLAMRKNPTASRILTEVQDHPGIAQHQLSARTALRASTVHWHMERLQQGGFVTAARDGRSVRYYPGPAMGPAALPAPAAAPMPATQAAA